MVDIKNIKIQRTRFIERETVFDIDVDRTYAGEYATERSVKLRPELLELGIAFSKYKVEIKCLLSADNRYSSEWDELKATIRDFCDSKFAGFWSWKLSRVRDNSRGFYRMGVSLSFEYESELELFLKECATLIKLSN